MGLVLGENLRNDDFLPIEIRRLKEVIAVAKPEYTYCGGRKFIGKLSDDTQFSYTLNEMFEECVKLKFGQDKTDCLKSHHQFQIIVSLWERLEKLDGADESGFYSDVTKSCFLKIIVWIRKFFGNFFAPDRKELIISSKIIMPQVRYCISQLCSLELALLENGLSTKESEVKLQKGAYNLKMLDLRREKLINGILESSGSVLNEVDVDLRDHENEISAAEAELKSASEPELIKQLKDDISAWKKIDADTREFRAKEHENRMQFRRKYQIGKEAREKEADVKINHNHSIELEMAAIKRKIGELKKIILPEPVPSGAVIFTDGLPTNSALDDVANKIEEFYKSNEIFKIFNLEESYTQDQLKLAYRELALKVHPDKNLEAIKRAEEVFKELGVAFQKCLNRLSRS